jgi:hypothetical protein
MVSLKTITDRVQALMGRKAVQAPHATPPTCGICGDTGWRLLIVEAKGRTFEAVVRCSCRQLSAGPTLSEGEILAARVAALGKATK